VKIKVQYLGLLSSTLRCSEEELTLESGTSVQDCFNLLTKKYGDQFTSVMFRSSGKLRPMTRVLVNDEDIRDGEGVNTKLDGHLEMSLTVGIYPSSGGST
jgi:molybdopterin converting factor small subunit